MSLESRFWRKVQRDESGCWEWTAGRDHNGYGRFSYQGKNRHAHRIAWLLSEGEIPEETPCVLHRCDNPGCVNPDHLFVGTQGDNVRDMIAKGRRRQGDARGEKHGRAKLTARDVAWIRKACAEGSPKRQIAILFRVSDSHISDIANRKKWRHV